MSEKRSNTLSIARSLRMAVVALFALQASEAFAQLTISTPIYNGLGCSGGIYGPQVQVGSYVVATTSTPPTFVQVDDFVSSTLQLGTDCSRQTTYTFIKPDNYKAFHQDQLNAATQVYNLLQLTSAVSGGLPSTLSQALPQTPAGQTISGVLGSLGSIRGGPGAVAVSILGIFESAYWFDKMSIEQYLINDPPDLNYTQLFRYSNALMPTDLDLTTVQTAFLQTGFADLTQLLETQQGELLSLERAWGAFQAGDVTDADAQIAAYLNFTAAYDSLAPVAGDWMGSVQQFLQVNNFDTAVQDPSNFYAALDTGAQALGGNPGAGPPDVSVPEPAGLDDCAIALAVCGFLLIQKPRGARRKASV
jgi:hypothetical protein